MNYETAEKQLKANSLPEGIERGYSYYHRNTYLNRRDGYIGVDLERYKDLVKFYPDGRIEISFENPDRIRRWEGGGGNTINYPANATKISVSHYVRYTLNNLELGYYFYPHSYHTMMTKGTAVSHDLTKGWEVPERIMIDKDGNIISQTPAKSLSFREISQHYNREYARRENNRRRGRFWTRRARNLYLDRSGCTKKGTWGCATRGWRRNGNGRAETMDCGCRFYRKNIKFRYTVKRILDEPNATVRACMIKLYGVDRFFNDAKAGTIDKYKDYQLLELKLPPTADRNQNLNNMRALRMVCPSTGQVYVNLVPQDRMTVQAALDWMFNTTNYLGRVKQAT